MMKSETDVFVIGGGPAGLAAAIAMRQRGFQVIVADGSKPPIDKACGEGLLPDGRAALAQLGISVPAADSHSLRGIRFVSAGLNVHASFPHGEGIGVRRTALHRLMVARAEALGVSFLWQTPVSGLHADGVCVGNQIVRSRWIVGADGGSSLVRGWARLDRYRTDHARYAFRRHYRVAPWSDCMEIHWGSGAQIYITPVASDEVCVALVSRDMVSRDPHLRLDQALASFPEVAIRLCKASPSSPERGAVSSTRQLRQVYAGRVALVGDASGAIDVITGEGLCLAFRQAQVLAGCFTSGDLRHYQQQHRALARRPIMMARLMLALDWNTSFRQRVMRAFEKDPRLFEQMLAMHVGELSPLRFASSGISLGWQMCVAGSPTAA
jgi:flavin-dependent dehydrogenase